MLAEKEIAYYPARHFLQSGEAAKKYAGLQLTVDQTEVALTSLHKLGIYLHPKHVHDMAASYDAMRAEAALGMDADYINPLTTPSITTPIQFLQEWLPGFVHIVTQARMIDTLIGYSVQGAWETEEVIQGVMDLIGSTAVYGDYTNVPLSSWNVNFERRTVVRFEEGLDTGVLEEARASRMNVSSSAAKRQAAMLVLEIRRNEVGFFGYNNGNNRTFGFLNDPQSPSYVSVALGASGFTTWLSKTFEEIIGDIRTFYSSLRARTGSRLQDGLDNVTLAVASSAYDNLTKVTDQYGYSVLSWLRDSYDNTRVVAVPELDAADGGENVAYLYLDSASDVPIDQGQDSSTDDQRTYVQPIPTKFQTVGVQRTAKTTLESYSNATAGSFLKRPYNIYRATGI